jgi:hypothetical protein
MALLKLGPSQAETKKSNIENYMTIYLIFGETASLPFLAIMGSAG